jgi:membrane protein implicated in regulation of membrane protease activity
MSSTATQASVPSTSELVEGVLFYPIALVISATIFPGFTLCIPALLFVTVLILVPLVAMAIVALLVAAVIAAPVVLVRAVRGLRERRAESPRRSRLRPGYLAAPTAAVWRRDRGAPQPVKIEG